MRKMLVIGMLGAVGIWLLGTVVETMVNKILGRGLL
jgi:hypothetical protein